MHHFKRYFPLFVLPTLLAFCVAFLLPFLLGVFLSFTEFQTVADARWVGLQNYGKAFQNGEFLQALWFTTAFTVVSIVTINVFAFFLAVLLTKSIQGTNVFRTVFFMPNLIGGIVLGYLWQVILNGILSRVWGVDLTFAAKYGFWGLVILMNWQMVGYMMVIYIAGLQSISDDVLEAASIDGATGWQTLLRVKIPLVMPSVTICTFLTLTNSFKLFDQNFALTGGAPGRETSMLALDIYDTFYGRAGDEGVGQAKAVVFFLIVAAVAFLQLRLTRSGEVER